MGENMKFTKILLLATGIASGGYASAETPAPQADQSKSRILVAYYSLTGKTEQVAQAIANISGGELYQIQVDKAYPDDKKERRKILEQEIEDNYLPPLKPTTTNPENYSIIFLGSPVWGNHISQPVKSFLAKYDFAGRNVIPFVTHSGGGRGQSFNDVASLCTGCIVDMDGWSSWGAATGRALTKWVNQQITDIE